MLKSICYLLSYCNYLSIMNLVKVDISVELSFNYFHHLTSNIVMADFIHPVILLISLVFYHSLLLISRHNNLTL
ncbi:hypothetical protein JHK85_018401 [Glycine max]|nr:hypothetical protein JHK85_018401 [Glycine max]